MEPYSVVITSCGRFDLLRMTLGSLLSNLDVEPEKIIVIEDSGDAQIRNVISEFPGNFHVLINEVKLGQIASIDRAYQSVTSPLIFHCEDDWEFMRSGFVQESAALLEQFPHISMVGLRDRKELNPLMRGVASETLGNVKFYFYDPARHPEYSFNPGLRRLCDYRRLGPFGPIGHEPDISYKFKVAGFRMAALEIAAVRHAGWERHIDDPFQPQRSRTLFQRLHKSFNKRKKRFQRKYLTSQ